MSLPNYPNSPTIGQEFTLPSGVVMVCQAVAPAPLWEPKPEFKNYIFPVESVNALRLTAGEYNGQTVQLVSYYAGANKGGGVLVWNSTSTAADDGGVTFAVTGVATGRWVRSLDGYVTPEMFGCTGSSPQELASMQSAFNFCAATGLELKGSYNHTINGTLTIQSGLRLVGGSDFKLLECTLRAEGGLDNEVSLTTAILAGATQIPVSSTVGFAVGDYIRIISCINAQSPAAGRFLLGDRRGATDITYLSEFAEIRSIGAGVINLASPLIFDYSVTPDADSGARTQTSIYKVDFVDNVSFSDVVVQRTSTTTSNPPLLASYLGPNVKFNNVHFDCSAASYLFARPMNLTFCYGTAFEYCDFIGIINNSLSGSQGNTEMRACQDVKLINCYQSGGNQGIDVTTGGSETVLGGPSIRVQMRFCEFENTVTDAGTSHWGCYQTEFYKCNVKARSQNGIRIRSRGDKVIGCNIYKLNSTPDGSGIYIAEIPYKETEVYDNTVVGFRWGLRIDCNLLSQYTINELSFVDFGPEVSRNTFTRCNQGVLIQAPATNRKIGARLLINKFTECTDGVRLGVYANNCYLSGNHHFKCTNGVYIDKNSIGTIIRHEIFEDCTARAIRGTTSATAQVLDTATFGTLANAGFSIRDNYYINSPSPASMSTGLTGLLPSNFEG